MWVGAAGWWFAAMRVVGLWGAAAGLAALGVRVWGVAVGAGCAVLGVGVGGLCCWCVSVAVVALLRGRCLRAALAGFPFPPAVG